MTLSCNSRFERPCTRNWFSAAGLRQRSCLWELLSPLLEDILSYCSLMTAYGDIHHTLLQQCRHLCGKRSNWPKQAWVCYHFKKHKSLGGKIFSSNYWQNTYQSLPKEKLLTMDLFKRNTSVRGWWHQYIYRNLFWCRLLYVILSSELFHSVKKKKGKV